MGAATDADRAYDRRRYKSVADGAWQPSAAAEPVRRHLLRLRAARMSTAGIAAAAGVTQRTVRGVLAGERTTVQGATAAALLAVPLPVADGPACRDDPERAYDETRTADAKAACLTCPVAAMCRDTAIRTCEPWGVWGGLTVVERERARTGRPVIACSGCGLDCVPADGDLCSGCRPTDQEPAACQAGASIVLPYRDLVTSLSLDRWETPDIARLIGRTDHAVRHAQRRWGLPVTAAARGGRSNLKPCGTSAAARRHQRRGEDCPVCAEAETRRWKDRKAAPTDREDVAA